MDAMPDEKILGAPNTGVRFERNAAQQLEYAGAAVTAERVPEQVSQNNRDECQGQRERQIDLAGTGQCAGRDQQWSSGDRQTHLFEQYPSEQHGIAVPNQEVGRLFQGQTLGRRERLRQYDRKKETKDS